MAGDAGALRLSRFPTPELHDPCYVATRDKRKAPASPATPCRYVEFPLPLYDPTIIPL
ncbi:hypothetical protein [Reticulibacter mediterranei]|uniref:hypothetical protein n=1 Tax=Reticulibacter mediterranei TaxID=2778369 RepID=UPI001C68FAA4|nr:hypothetical protein [Reticulibacter mediterranei]